MYKFMVTLVVLLIVDSIAVAVDVPDGIMPYILLLMAFSIGMALRGEE